MPNSYQRWAAILYDAAAHEILFKSQKSWASLFWMIAKTSGNSKECIALSRKIVFFSNQDLSPHTKRIVCAHEIGHDRLHRALAKGDGLQEFVLYKMDSIPEYEANIVAAEILLNSDEVLEYIYDYGYTSAQIAQAMHTDINLIALKIAHLAETGHDLRRIDYRSDFLK